MKHAGYTKDPVQRRISALKGVIEEALVDPVYAVKLAKDEDYPDWIRQIAEKLADDQELNYSLMRVVQSCVENPRVAARWAKAAHNGGMADWFRAFAETFAKRKKFPL